MSRTCFPVAPALPGFMVLVMKSRRSNPPLSQFETDRPLPANPGEWRLQQILVPIDFSDSSRKALEYAVSLARQFQAEVQLFHVIVAEPPSPQVLALEGDRLIRQYRARANRQLSQWIKAIRGEVRVRPTVQQGVAAHHEIIEAARRSQCDLIVIGNHGRTGLKGLFIGGTAERVVRHAPCPVLVIREREHDFLDSSRLTAVPNETDRLAKGTL